jgi:deferrochelatase/peroxidase EfeB
VDEPTGPGALSRRSLLTGAVSTVGLIGGAAALAGCAAATDGSGAAPTTTASDAAPNEGATAASVPEHLPFFGPHQTGVTARHQANGLMAAFTVTAAGRDGLIETLRALTDESERIMTGKPYEERDGSFPPLYTGHITNPPPPHNLTIVVSVGASLFDDRFGLADRKPVELVKMPFLANDRLDPERSHGDLLLTISSDSQDMNLFALRQLTRATRSSLALHWMLEGYNRRVEAEPGEAGVRNLMGFIDGTANLDPAADAQMDASVWVAAEDPEPPGVAGGSYHVVRTIRMLVEFWDRTRLSEQEALIGRRKSNGAPLDGEQETDLPDFAADPDGTKTPLDAHIRLANPRTAEVADQVILRKGFSYSRGFDGAGQLDQGLAFVSFQRSIERQFLPIQKRRDGEPLEEYIRPEGGGFFFAPPGVPEPGRFLGDGLFEPATPPS